MNNENHSHGEVKSRGGSCLLQVWHHLFSIHLFVFYDVCLLLFEWLLNGGFDL